MSTPSSAWTGGGNYLPAAKTRIGNRPIVPKQPVSTMPVENLDPSTGRPVDKAGFGMPVNGGISPQQSDARHAIHSPGFTTTPNPGNPQTTSVPTGGLLGINVSQPVKPDSPQLNYQPGEYQSVTGDAAANAPKANVPTINWTAQDYKDHGYSAEQTKESYSYDPRSESMVQNQLTGLLDPNSGLMRRAIANANAYSASRGLQSSSIATGAAQSSMIDKALPIAQQDASTNMQADQIGWNQSFTAEQNNADRRQQLTAINAQGSVSNQLQNSQMGFQQASQQAQMAMQSEMQELQYKQSLGMLDAQGQQRMQELNTQQGFQAQMADLQYQQQLGTLDYQGQLNLQNMERGAQLQDRRDQIMQKFDMAKMDKGFLQDLEKTRIGFEFEDSRFEKQVDAQTAMDYRNGSANAYNNYLEQVAAVYSNPNMTPEQQAAGVAQLQQMFQKQQSALQAIYGFAAPAQPGVDTNPGTGSGPATGGGGNQFNPPIMQPGTGGGGTVNPNPGTVIPNRPGGGTTQPVIDRPAGMIR